jgi:ATP-dependent Clp protease ATP-binding subunit ClpA
MLNEVREDVEAKGMTVSISEAVIDYILEKGYDAKYGARPLRRTIQRLIEDELSEAYLMGKYKSGSRIEVVIENDAVGLR